MCQHAANIVDIAHMQRNREAKVTTVTIKNTNKSACVLVFVFFFYFFGLLVRPHWNWVSEKKCASKLFVCWQNFQQIIESHWMSIIGTNNHQKKKENNLCAIDRLHKQSQKHFDNNHLHWTSNLRCNTRANIFRKTIHFIL